MDAASGTSRKASWADPPPVLATSGIPAQSLGGNPGREPTGRLEHGGLVTPTSPRMETQEAVAVQTLWSGEGELGPFRS